MYTLTCKYCKKSFEKNQKKYKYCCWQCSYDDKIGRHQHPNAGKKRTKKPTEFICKYCNETFERFINPSTSKKCTFEFCSPACRNKARIKDRIPCPECNKMFLPSVNSASVDGVKYCSNQCSKNNRKYNGFLIVDIEKDIIENYPEVGPNPFVEKYGLPILRVYGVANRNGIKGPNPKGNAPKSNPPKKFVCIGCGNEFERIHYPSRKVPQFCSNECKKIRVGKNCKYCNKYFEVRPSRVNTELYCSNECSSEGVKRDKTYCSWCGKYYRPKKTGGKYCSLECFHEHEKSTRKIKTCEVCGENYWVRKGTKHTRFCGRKCQMIGITRKGPDNPNWRGGPLNGRGPNWKEQASKARKRDNYTCQKCGLQQRKPRLSVHHIVPYRDFNGDYETANQLSNLITYCISCHMSVENEIKQRDEVGQYASLQ